MAVLKSFFAPSFFTSGDLHSESVQPPSTASAVVSCLRALYDDVPGRGCFLCHDQLKAGHYAEQTFATLLTLHKNAQAPACDLPILHFAHTRRLSELGKLYI